MEIVVAINIKKDQRKRAWNNDKGVLSGSIDKYFIEIGCWKIRDKKTTKLNIRCPFAVGFDFKKQ